MGQFPYQASLRTISLKLHICGGSIISDRFILTAAHCVVGVTIRYVIVGSIYSNGLEGVTYVIENAVSHQDYQRGPIVLNDIALLKTTSKIKFTDYVKPIPIKYEFVGRSQTVLLAGFGDIDNNQTVPVKLQYQKFKTISNKECSKAGWGHYIHPSHLCVKGVPSISACSGDSGGALAVNGSLVGIVSFGPKNCGLGYPDVYTRVSEFREWIEDNMAL